ncbi:3-hydroxyacyl-CoA dehydrogenase family protein [Fusibacter paucivorans]|uniref:3-hydroxyacyl-CoA dehydrogenase family protein n=1 Tax=Fusibacter paucivorans TaxID=76009 RepID=A0ABS5PJV3_9FIRM|nr:3-hydroxyacyl-CoA dehydrogenase family protein [Fusibacter paucivorans]MBS7525273.1 3-hydroxyacyl-CoA dehydrogenase family protein [Fusibacter paucivorans]
MKLEMIKKIAIIGAGTMGPGIAQVFAMHAYEVVLFDIDTEKRQNAKKMIRVNLETFVEEGYLAAEAVTAVLDRIAIVDTMAAAVADAQFVIESVSEKPEIKQLVYREMDALLSPDVIIVSNASALNPFSLMPERRLRSMAAAHFFAPPHIVPLVEVAVNEQTSEETLNTVMSLLTKCEKVPVKLEKFLPGYMINRFQIILNTEIFYLLDNGYCTPEQIDLAVKSSFMLRGMVLGLVQRYDFTGLDISANNIINGSYVMPEMPERPPCLFDKVERGELGVKTGKGFYDYQGRSAEDVQKKRDKMLLKVLKATKSLMDEQI